jgi:hypothetical protein
VKISNGTVIFDFSNKLITRKASNTHARPGHQPIYVEKDRTDTDLYICSQNYYNDNNILAITGVECPNYQKFLINDFKLRKDVFNSYVNSLKSAFSEYGLNEFYKDNINDIFIIFNDLRTSVIVQHSTQQKVRIGFGDERVKKIIFDSLIGDLTQITLDFSSKEILLSLPRQNLLSLLEEVGKAKYIIKEEPINDYELSVEANRLQMFHEELMEKYGEDGNVVHEMLKTRSSSLQTYFRDLLLKKYKKCLLCDISDEEILIASHIKPSAASNVIEKGDLNNGLLLCPLHDKLFDKGYITFDSKTGELVLDKSVLDKKNLYRLDTSIRYVEVINNEIENYMRYHNSNIFKGDFK